MQNCENMISGCFCFPIRFKLHFLSFSAPLHHKLRVDHCVPLLTMETCLEQSLYCIIRSGIKDYHSAFTMRPCRRATVGDKCFFHRKWKTCMGSCICVRSILFIVPDSKQWRGWMDAMRGCSEMRDRVRGESYCLLENYGPRVSIPAAARPGQKPIDCTGLKDTGVDSCQVEWEAQGRREKVTRLLTWS